MTNSSDMGSEKPLLHLVFGGRVTDPQGLDFEDLDKVEVVGIFPSYREAEKAWRGVSQANVDDAMKKYVIVHLHRLLEPNLK
ncbi:inositol monophosphatase [Iodidimonas gelatinilytica]|uniref:Inositol monophosphatase n=1 Tax=Iodidimonas gelatinilytica TaxID=1236966 RepID=A0A5A7MNZ4_9PROT|nr:DUF4170 domain-containing protein [Iodidimonas gelatinilytica]GEQ96873.1 inositol monophosphatase [Iodidimonas gelatinilytica]GER01130.1 inositol monophosphatase [Iodidimonas gelatinilytica]